MLGRERRRSASENSGLDQTLCPDVYDNYSILMYETQDAFKHSEKLLRKLKSCEEQLHIASNQCKQLLEEKTDLEKSIISLAKNSQEKEEKLSRIILENEEKLKLITKRNEILEKQLNLKEESLSLNKTTFSIEAEVNLTAESSFKIEQVQLKSEENFFKKYKRDNNSKMDETSVTEDTFYDTCQEKETDVFQTESESKCTREAADFSKVNNEIKKVILKTKSIQKENNATLQKIVKQCCEMLKENGFLLKTLYDENNTATIKIEKWINGYMILKRKKEEEDEFSKREHARSVEFEMEYRNQIKNLCEMITQLNDDVGIERAQTQTYKETLSQVYRNLEELDIRFENISNLALEKLSNAEMKVKNLIQKCNQIQSSPTFQKKNKRLSKNLFKLKRRMSDSKEKF